MVSNHGYFPPGEYAVGFGLAQEEDALVESGFVVLHPDYRGYGRSERLSPVEQGLRLAYSQDVVNAADALKTLSFVDPTRTAMVGRSMGGALTVNALATHPGLVRAAVIYAPLSSDFIEGARVLDQLGANVTAPLFETFGGPDTSADLYRDLSSTEVLNRVTEPLLIHHGTDDQICPIGWSRATQRLLEASDVASTLREWPGEGHVFTRSAGPATSQTVAFLREKLDLPPQ